MKVSKETQMVTIQSTSKFFSELNKLSECLNFYPFNSTKYGMYSKEIGLENLTISWGHDEYLYRVLKHNNTTLPKYALNIIRYHSFYPWHSAGDYSHLMKEEDEETKKWVLTFK